MISDRDFSRRLLQTVATVTAVMLGLAVLYVARDALMLIYISALIAMGFAPLVGACRDNQETGRHRDGLGVSQGAGALQAAADLNGAAA